MGAGPSEEITPRLRASPGILDSLASPPFYTVENAIDPLHDDVIIVLYLDQRKSVKWYRVNSLHQLPGLFQRKKDLASNPQVLIVQPHVRR